jgi:hypothetical protein
MDVIGFLGLGGLFTAHITGNLVIVAAHVVTGEAAQWAAILSVPVFMLVLCLARLSAGGFETIGLDSLRPLLLVHRSECGHRHRRRDACCLGNGGAERSGAGFFAWRAGHCRHNNQYRALHDGCWHDPTGSSA